MAAQITLSGFGRDHQRRDPDPNKSSRPDFRKYGLNHVVGQPAVTQLLVVGAVWDQAKKDQRVLLWTKGGRTSPMKT